MRLRAPCGNGVVALGLVIHQLGACRVLSCGHAAEETDHVVDRREVDEQQDCGREDAQDGEEGPRKVDDTQAL